MSTKHFNIKKSDNILKRLVFRIDNIDVSVVNSVRRVILSEIPNIAVAFEPYDKAQSDITVLKNTTSFHNEFIGHRISLIPVCVSPSQIDGFSYKFVINVHNQGNQIIDVTTNHIQVIEDGNVSKELHNKFFPVDPITKDPIIITKLKPNNYNNNEGEALHVEFTARKGQANKHARWCPVSTCTYFNIIDDAAANDALDRLLKDAESSDKTKIKNKFSTLDRQRFIVKNEQDEPSAFMFTIETECGLTPSYLFSTALDILINKLESIVGTPGRLHITDLDKKQNLYMARLDGEDHTIGNLFQSLAYNMFVRDKDTIDFIGYVQPHPLENYIVFKIRFKQDDASPEQFFSHASKKMAKLLSRYKDEWENAIN
jgi:DNA-directed RNA polymerase subunit L/DNA-directed RNA polymerase alpha subunit